MQMFQKNEPILLSDIIWGNDINLFIDGEFHHSPDYKQILIIIYKDLLTNLKIPCFYILINGKYEIFF